MLTHVACKNKFFSLLCVLSQSIVTLQEKNARVMAKELFWGGGSGSYFPDRFLFHMNWAYLGCWEDWQLSIDYCNRVFHVRKARADISITIGHRQCAYLQAAG